MLVDIGRVTHGHVQGLANKLGKSVDQVANGIIAMYFRKNQAESPGKPCTDGRSKVHEHWWTGKPVEVTAAQVRKAHARLAAGTSTGPKETKRLGISRATLYRKFQELELGKAVRNETSRPAIDPQVKSLVDALVPEIVARLRPASRK